MLKITRVVSKDHVAHLRLEGRVVGAWVGELERCWKEEVAARPIRALDLAGVTFADERGIAFLKTLAGNGVRLVDCPLFLSGLL
jgi:hypothetical protein